MYRESGNLCIFKPPEMSIQGYYGEWVHFCEKQLCHFVFDFPSKWGSALNPIALRMAKTP